MVVSADKRLLWHPLRKNRFVVGGTAQITLYEWRPEAPEIKQISSQHDLQLMKCFAWSPDPSFDDLVAVGMSTGRVDLMRLEASKYARDTVLSSGPSVSLPVRSSRSCNALAFCPLDPNYLAVGLDKVRGDSSLVIWDISTATPTLSLRESTSLTVNSVTSSSRLQPLIPRAEFGPKTDTRILQQHAPTEIVSSLSYVTQSTCLLWAGISNRWLRLFDLRTPVPSTTNVASKVQAIATDPFDSHRIGTFGDGIVSIWDSRRLPHPLVTFTENDASADGSKFRPNHSTFNTLEFSSVRRGVLATLEKESTHVRFWDLQEAKTSEIIGDRSRDSSRSISGRPGGGKLSWANPTSMLSWTASSGSNASFAGGNEHTASTPASHIILSDTRKTKDFPGCLASFALVPSTRAQPLSSNVIVVNKDGDLEVYAVHDTPNHGRWSNQGDFIMAVGSSYRAFSGFYRKEQGPNPWNVPALSHLVSGEKSAGDPDPSNTEEFAPPMLTRGRSQSMFSSPTFGRGDEDGFPALNTLVIDGGDSGHKSRSAARTATNDDEEKKGKEIHRTGSLTRTLKFPREPEVGSLSRADKLVPQRHIRHPHHRHSSRNKQISASEKLRQVIRSDISIVMRRRTVKGYGVANLAHNSVVVDDDPVLSELWSWIDHSRRLLQTPKPRTHGYDFAYQGLLGIWEGFPPSAGRIPNDTAPPPSPAAGFKPLALERSASSSDIVQQFSTQGRTKLTSSKRRTQFFVDSVIAGASGVLDPYQDAFSMAVSTLSTKDGDKERGLGSWKPGTPTAKLVQRRFGLELCGWSLREEELNNAIRIWESENKQSQAACWLVFIGQHQKAVDVLMRSKDETHYLLSGTLAALCSQVMAESGAKINSDLRQHCERLIVKLQDPYLRAMLTHLTSNDWSEVLDEESIPLRERLVIALQFLDDKSLSSYLRRIVEEAIHRGDISGLIVTGLTSSGIDILQSYVDITGDVQTAAILSCFRTASALADISSKVGGRNARDPKKVFIDRWVETYQDLLDGWKLFYHRCQFDIDRGQLLQEAIREGDVQPFGEWIPRQVVIRCNYCNKTIDVINSKSRGPNACPNCGRGLPRCSICLMTLTVVPDASRDAKLVHTNSEDTINEAIVFCQTCRHGGHASHIMEWFFGEIEDGDELANGGRVHNVCPVPDCDCRCTNEL